MTSKRLWAALLGFLALSHLLAGCSALGTNPDDERKERFLTSQQYNPQSGKFENKIAAPMMKGSTWEVMKNVFFSNNESTPLAPLPESKPDLAEFLAPSEQLKFIWLGHSTFLLRMDGKTVLVDPIFSEYASPVPVYVKRFQAPMLALADLPQIDVVVISHDHYDHLDMKTVQHFKDKKTRFVTPLGVGSHLEGWGIKPDQITDLDWWQKTEIDGLTFTCTPAQHFSGRTLSRNETLWASWVVQGQQERVFYSGDSGYSPHYRRIGETLGPFDVTFLEAGQYNKNWPSVHQMPEETVQAHLDLKGKTLVPVHWGMFDLSPHPWHEPIERVSAEAQKKGVNLFTPKLGQLVGLATPVAYEQWWTRKTVLQQVQK